MNTNKPMTSKERLLNTINHRQTDRVPLFLRFWPIQNEIDTIPFDWKNQITRVENQLKQGMDDTLLLQPPLGYIEDYDVNKVPGVKSSVKIIPPGDGEEYPVLIKEYDTPEGTLRHAVRKTEDWIHGNDIFLFSDYNVPRALEHIIKDMDDIKRLRYLLNDPDSEQVNEFRKEAGFLRSEAQRLGVVLDGGWCSLGDTAVMLCGMERILIAQMDEPEFIESLLNTILEWEMKRIDMVLAEGVDVIVHMAWYEGTDFWTPGNYRSMLKPGLMKMIKKVHEKGKKFRYIITKGWKPVMDDLLEMGVDCITGVDPVQDNINLKEIKEKIGDKICLMGGVNSPIMFTQWSDEKIMEAVDETMDIMAPGGGFIMFPVDAVFNDMPWDKVQVLINRWKSSFDFYPFRD